MQTEQEIMQEVMQRIFDAFPCMKNPATKPELFETDEDGIEL